jgi:L-gulonolactone oxidase
VATVTEWRNWAGGASCRPRQYHAPATEAQLREIVADLPAPTRSLRVAGSGHSFPPIVPTGDVLVSLENYTGVVEVDADARRATVRAGTTLGDLTDELATHGLAMENLGDIDAQTVAGAISTGTHGTGIDLGILSTQVAGLRLVTADGDIVELGPADGDAFRAATVSLGSLGVISTVTLDLVPAYDLRLHARPMPLSECLADLERLRTENRHFEFFWFPHTDTAFVKTMNRTDDPHTGRGGDFDSRLENLAWEGMCRLSSAVPATTAAMSKLAALSFSQERSVAPSHEQFAHDRAVRFEESEWSVPADDGAAVVRAIRSWIEDSGEDVCFPVEFRYVAGDDIPLSPAYGRDSAFVAVHKYHRKPYRTYFDAVASICDRHEGRPHWGKHHDCDAADLAARYPEWDRFRAVRREFDPEGLFLNDHLRELFGERVSG